MHVVEVTLPIHADALQNYVSLKAVTTRIILCKNYSANQWTTASYSIGMLWRIFISAKPDSYSLTSFKVLFACSLSAEDTVTIVAKNSSVN